MGHRLRSVELPRALQRATSAEGIARELAAAFGLGELRPIAQVAPRFACRCSRERFVAALRSLGPAELRDMASRDGGASATCDFCAESYRLTAEELRDLAERPSSGRPT
jgi:molecular chaperone Hsp33